MKKKRLKAIADRLEELVTFDRNRGRYNSWTENLLRAVDENGCEILPKAPLLDATKTVSRP